MIYKSANHIEGIYKLAGVVAPGTKVLTKVPGQPRGPKLATLSLGAKSGSDTPINAFRPNWKKLGSSSDAEVVRDALIGAGLLTAAGITAHRTKKALQTDEATVLPRPLANPQALGSLGGMFSQKRLPPSER